MNDSEALANAMGEFFRANDIDEIQWVPTTGDYEMHGKYLIAMWIGMDKPEAYHWIKDDSPLRECDECR